MESDHAQKSSISHDLFAKTVAAFVDHAQAISKPQIIVKGNFPDVLGLTDVLDDWDFGSTGKCVVFFTDGKALSHRRAGLALARLAPYKHLHSTRGTRGPA